jgi:hypothetical protein
MITVFGIGALSFMMIMYALESRGRGYTLGFAVGCALSGAYALISGAWPFAVVEAVWFLVALRRFAARAQDPVPAKP